MIRFTKKQTGDTGENYCAAYMKKHGYKILDRNYKKSYGEIDIIALKDGVLCFTEVKTRHSNPMTQPYEAVDYRKRRRIIKAAQAYIAENRVDRYCRFDVCEVITDIETLKLLKINYIEAAFEA